MCVGTLHTCLRTCAHLECQLRNELDPGSCQSRHEAKVALDIVKGLPQRALALIRSEAFQGADLIRLDSDVARPSFRAGECTKMVLDGLI